MAIRTKSLDDMVREIIASLRSGEKGRPQFTLLLGSGFSYPIVPTATEMLRGDVAWWLYHSERKIKDAFCYRKDAVAQGLATEVEIAESERMMWQAIHALDAATPVLLGVDGLPDLTNPESIGLAYQVLMDKGLFNNRMRRQYLRDAIRRSGRRVNGAHIFLAAILEAQENWGWGAPFCRTIFTTNFDPLLQRSLQLVNKLYFMSDRPDRIEPPDDDESDAIHLVYTHGSVHRYDLLNTEDQIEFARKQNASGLVGYFKRRGVIVIGYSGWADTTMEALLSCPSFDSNLYWCGMHSAAEAETQLRPEARRLLEAREKKAFYVPVKDGAGEVMRLLHRSLNLGPVPKFILAPVPAMTEQLRSIDVSSEPAASVSVAATPMAGDLKTILDTTLALLDVAKSAFDDPTIVKSGKGEDEVASTLIAKLLGDALLAYWEKKPNEAIRLWSAVIETPQVPAKDRAVALYSRGVVTGETGDTAKAIADYSAVIDMPDAPADEKAKAFVNRGIRWGVIGETTKEIADYSAVIDMADAPADEKAKALRNRGICWAATGDTTKAIADYSGVIDMPDAPADQKAKALVNRGIRWGVIGETTKEIADYSAVIDMPDAPANEKAMALYNRGASWDDDTSNAITDYSAVIDMLDAPTEQKAAAFLNRGWKRFAGLDDAASMVDDSRRALELDDKLHAARANLGLGLLLTGEGAAGRAEYETLLSQTTDEKAIRPAIDDLEEALRERPDLPAAAGILDLLRAALPDKPPILPN
jgi:tetratricopeptide (TPR) repeat protein